MATQQQYDVRTAILDMLFEKVRKDAYPSTTYLDLIEGLLEPDDVPAYIEMMLEKFRADVYPSIPMMRRLQKFA
jgi:hypothetical protein